MKWSTKTTNVAPIRDFNGNNKWWLVMLGNLQIYVQRITCYYCWVLASEAAAEQDSRKQNRNIGITPRKRFPRYHHRYCCLCGGSGVVVLQWKVFLCRFQWDQKKRIWCFLCFCLLVAVDRVIYRNMFTLCSKVSAADKGCGKESPGNYYYQYSPPTKQK